MVNVDTLTKKEFVRMSELSFEELKSIQRYLLEVINIKETLYKDKFYINGVFRRKGLNPYHKHTHEIVIAKDYDENLRIKYILAVVLSKGDVIDADVKVAPTNRLLSYKQVKQLKKDFKRIRDVVITNDKQNNK